MHCPILTRSTNAVSIAFLAPANNGAAITGYATTCTSNNGGAPGTTSAPRRRRWCRH